jgi:hypothetical protein
MKASQIKFDKKRSKIIVIVALVFCSLTNIHFLFSHSIIKINTFVFTNNNESTKFIGLCTNKIWFNFYENYWPFIDATIYSFLPLILISTFNTTIIICVVRETKKSSKLQKKRKISIKDAPKRVELNSNCQIRTRLMSVSSVLSTNSIISKRSIYTTTNNEISLKYLSAKRRATIGGINSERRLIRTSASKSVKTYKNGNRRMTLMIFFINISFCVLTLPIVILQIIYQSIVNDTTAFYITQNSTEINSIEESMDQLMDENFFNLLKSIFELLQYLNHGINFILYCLFGKTFRTATNIIFLKFLKLFLPKKI